jgi:hypothetical protein
MWRRFSLQLPSGQIGKSSTAIGFWFLSFSFEKKFKVLSCFIQKWNQPSACSDHGLYGLWAKTAIFSTEPFSKMLESLQLFFGLWLMSRIFEEFKHSATQTKAVQPFGGYFQQIKVLVLKKSSKFWAASYKNDTNLLLVRITVCMDSGQKPRSFPPNRSPKMLESLHLFFGLWLVSRIFEEFKHSATQTKTVQPFGGFFQQIKVLVLKKSSKFWAASYKMKPTFCLFGSRFVWAVGKNRDLFHRTVLPKCWKVYICSLDYGLWVEYLKNSNIPQPKPKQYSPSVDFFNK